MRICLFIVVVIGLIACKKTESAPPVAELPYFFIGTINGQTYAFGAGSPGALNSGQSIFEETDTLRDDSVHVYEGVTIYSDASTTLNSATVSIMRLFDHLPTPGERASVIDTGYYHFALSDSLDPSGASVRFTDGSGMIWTSEGRAQSDTSFRVEVLTPVPGSAAYTFQATFNCKLYSSAGDSVVLQNGSLRGTVPGR